MAWWQKKLLRYALSRTGLLEDQALDLDNLDITLGKKNVVELKDVGLNISRISNFAQLPPSIRVETAQVLSLRLTVPADIYQSSIVAEVDGVDLVLKLEEESIENVQGRKGRTRASGTASSPQHRKSRYRLRSPAPYDPGGSEDTGEEYLPTTEQLAKSFLLEEPAQERRQLEASVVANSKGLEESIASESSDGDGFGTGGGIGLPGFLASFLQGIIDRLQVKIRNVDVKFETKVHGDDQHPVPVGLQLRVGAAEFGSAPGGDVGGGLTPQQPKRVIDLKDISLNLLSNATVFSDLSELPSPASTADSKQRTGSPNIFRTLRSSGSKSQPSSPIEERASSVTSNTGRDASSPRSSDDLGASTLTAEDARFADAGEEDSLALDEGKETDFDIKPGEDNLSWGSRRSQSSAPPDGLWNSMMSEDDLPQSLLLERAATPRAQPSRDPSPTINRTRRNVSPYTRSLESPGSWPRLEESPEGRRYQGGPGSWPTWEQSHHSMIQSAIDVLSAPVAEVTDNKRAAVEASVLGRPDLSEQPEPEEEDIADLAESRMFSHEEAESMYMSAMMQSPEKQVPEMHIPGGWGDESDKSTFLADIYRSATQAIQASRPALRTDDGLAHGDQTYHTPSGNVTPRARSSDSAQPVKQELPTVSRQLLFVDTISVQIPVEQDITANEFAASSLPSGSVSYTAQDMPGTFSAYSSVANSRRTDRLPVKKDSRNIAEAQDEDGAANSALSYLKLRLGVIQCQMDIPSCRLLYRLVLKGVAPFGRENNTSPEQSRSSASKDTRNLAISMSIQQLVLALKESADGDLSSGPTTIQQSDDLLTLTCQKLDFSSQPGGTDLRIGSFSTLLGSSPMLSFDRSRNMRTSVIVSEQTPDIALTMSTRDTVAVRPVTDIHLETMPLDIILDLTILEETFEPFGGLSGVLEVGTSILSDSGRLHSPSGPTKSSKGVRFAGEPTSVDSGVELKLNVRLGGVSAKLQGSMCALQVRTTPAKLVYREQFTFVKIDQVLFTGPYLTKINESPLSVDLSTMQIEYLPSPHHKDLDRLIGLLTPSKDKYDTDDDILIDTLLRQRRKGAVMRATISAVKLNCLNLECLSSLSSLGTELSKLSAVTKYLPEDDRPGILSLICVENCEARLFINERFRSLHVGISKFECAHVGLPSLVALSIQTISASQNGVFEILHTLSSTTGAGDFPMIMARMLGDEVEPTIKVKLLNLCIEYSVPVVIALAGLDKEAEPEVAVAELAKSIAQLTPSLKGPHDRPSNAASDTSGSLSKKTNIDVLCHESGIGLNPQNLSSKALLVLTDARFSVAFLPKNSIAAKLELRKAGLFVADQVLSSSAETAISARAAPGNAATSPTLTTAFAQQGFVSVGSIMAMRVSVNVSEGDGAEAKIVDVALKSELLLLETCADSTQTLVATLGDLSPPTPPSTQQKYLTEPMTIEDMMASFTGEAHAKPEGSPETLFDIEEEPEDDADLMFDIPTFTEGDSDGLLADSEMTSNLYGPISGVLDVLDKLDDADDPDEDFDAVAESLLEDDPFEMPLSPSDAALSDNALMRELNKQSKSPKDDAAIDLGLYEVEDLRFDALGGNQTALGNRFRFNTPTVARRVKVPQKKQTPPFRLTLCDCHIIWNIYDGYDWQRTRDGITEAVEQVETKAEERKASRRRSRNEMEDEEPVIGDFLFNSIYIGVPDGRDAQSLRRQINRNIDDRATETESVPISGISKPTMQSASGQPANRRRRRLKLERGKAHKVAFELKGVSADVFIFGPHNPEVVSSMDIRIKDFEIFDNVPTSTWRKFLTQLSDHQSAREVSKPMAHIELLNVRTLENYAASELVMHVSVLPLRLHVDQDALDFITRFFEFKDEHATASSSDGEQPFIQRLEIDTVDLCLDYKPKTVDYVGLRSGHTTEFMNFIILEAANIRLRHAIIYGIKGFEPLHKTLNDIWMPDVKRNQLPTVLSGLAPVRGFANLGAGVRDVVAIPIREYRKDGRIVRSVQKGAFQFGKTTASELARLGAKVAIGTQNMLQGAEALLSPTSASSTGRTSPSRQDPGSDEESNERRAISAYSNQPVGVLSGLKSARRYLEHDLLTARDALIAVQGEVLESSSPGSAAAALARHAPTVILRPIIGTSRAVGTALLGVGNSFDRANIRRTEDKYKRH